MFAAIAEAHLSGIVPIHFLRTVTLVLSHAFCNSSQRLSSECTIDLSSLFSNLSFLHTHTHTRWFLWFTGTFHRRNGFYTVQAVCAIALHLHLNFIYFFLKKTHSVWFISVLNYGDTENVLINHLLLVIPMSYPCHYTNLCPHKPHKHAHTHTHTHTHTVCVYIYIPDFMCCCMLTI